MKKDYSRVCVLLFFVAMFFATENHAQVSLSISSSNNVTCFGGSNGSANTSVSGGTGPFTYVWSPSGGTNANATGLTAQGYTCTVTDNFDMTTATASVIIIQPTAITTTGSQVNVSCSLSCNGSATVIASGGNAPYTYAWAPSGGTGATASGLCAGTYTATITDANGCTATRSFSIAAPPAITASVSSFNAWCWGSCTGSASVVASGGTGVYTYSWAPSGGTGATATGLCAGTYTCTISSPAGCTIARTVVITQPSQVTASIVSVTPATCGNFNGSIQATCSGGSAPYTYFWSPSGGTGTTATNLASGTYTCTVTDANGCTATTTAVVTNTPGFTLSYSSSNATCSQNNGSASVAPIGGTPPFTFLWSNSSTNDTITNVGAGVYSVTVTDNTGCQNSGSVAVNNASGPTASVSSINNPTCYYNSLGSATVAASGNGPFSYLWNTSPVQTTPTATGLPAGTYFCTVTDANSCQTSTNVILNNPPQLYMGYQQLSFGNCATGGSARVWVNGGTPPYSYNWSNGSTNDTAYFIPPGSASVTTTDNAGCVINHSFNQYALTTAVITGHVFNDMNSNCIYDNGDLPVGGTTLLFTPNSTYTTTNALGMYAGNFYVTGNQSVNFLANSLNPHYVVTCPVSAQLSTFLNNMCDTAYNMDFAVSPIPGQQDLRVSISMPQNPRAGFPNNVYINYWNVGTTTVANTNVTLVYDSILAFTSSNITPSVNNIGFLQWNTGTLNPGDAGSMHVVLQVPTIQNGGWIGRPLDYTATINPIGGDVVPGDNVTLVNRHIVASWDPNEKISYTPNMDAFGNIPPADSVLEYTIHFQNTGTDTAFNIYVDDTLSPYLDPATIIPGASSHPYTMELRDSGLVRFYFYNIMLPDSGHNQLGSNGGVTFTIKTRPNLPLGTIIDNTAYIYFDFNPAVVTNTTSNMIWINVPLSVSEAASGSISSYPNPTNGKTTIRLSDEFAGKQNELVVTDAMGRSIMTKTFSGTSIDLDLADYSSGIYFCAIHSNGSMVGVKRLVKE